MASWALSLLVTAVVVGLPRAQSIAIDWSVGLFAIRLSVLTGLVFGLVPALQAIQQPIRQSLNEESRGGTGSARHRRIRSGLVVTEVGLALVLLVGAGLLLRSFAALTRVSTGFNARNLLVVNLPLSPQKYLESGARTAMVERVIDGVRAIPGVQSAGAMTTLHGWSRGDHSFQSRRIPAQGTG